MKSVIHQQVMLEGPESLKYPHILVLPENISISTFYMDIVCEMDPKVVKLVNLTKNWTFRPPGRVQKPWAKISLFEAFPMPFTSLSRKFRVFLSGRKYLYDG